MSHLIDRIICERLEPAIQDLMETRHIPGFAVGVANRAGEIYSRGFGVSHLGSEQATTPLSIFHMASLTKPFVATTIYQFIEQGQITLDTRLYDLLPEFRLADAPAQKITLRQMLTHTSGMPDVKDYGWDRPEYDDDALVRYVRSLSNQRLIGPPGERFFYSNIAFDVLGAVIAVLSGIAFEDAIQIRILDPLGMKYSTLLNRRIDRSLLTSPHVEDAAGQIGVSPVFPYNRPHAGSSTLTSNVVDMLRWARANLRRGELDGHRILNETSYASMWKPYAPAIGNPGPFANAQIGLSWFLVPADSHRLVGHYGWDTGFETVIFIDPDGDLALVAMSNYLAETHYVSGFGFKAMCWMLGL